MTIKTVSVHLVANEYRQISIGGEGVFIDRGTGVGNIVTLEGSAKPESNAPGDPVIPKKRYHYALEGGNIVWGKTTYGEAEVGVTPK